MSSCLAGKPERLGPVEVEDIRRALHGDFSAQQPQDSDQSQSENLQVFLRVRPFTASESDSGESQECVTIEGYNTVVLKAPKSCQSGRQSDKSLPQTAQKFTFTQVFGPEAKQKTVFEHSVRGLVRDVLDGGNCLVFTYGVTNAGKTFTFLGPDHDSGLLPRSLSVIFNNIEGRQYERSDLKPQRCRDFTRLTPDQQVAESNSRKNLLRLFKESDKNLSSGRSTILEGSSLSSDSSLNSVSDDSFCLDVDSNVRFSVWVSFCEIYNDNIHDLLEQVPGGHHKRTVLRLSQDVKGNSFIKDLRWVHVTSSGEAYKVMKIGKRNQSFSATRLNQLSSRSHSIFSIRIMRVEDGSIPRVLGISELSLCDLAGSERCSRTQNTGERLKEAGNINNSLLTLGKCINAIRLNQNNKVQHHVPFRESKLTHFLQFFFSGAGRVCMVVNINQNASCFDETLNVLKFSALAQKVVVLNARPVVPDASSNKSAMELSMVIDDQEGKNVTRWGRRSSIMAWETTLEDVLEDEDEEEDDMEEEEEEEEESVLEGTVLEAGAEEEEEEDRTMEEEQKSGHQAALRLVLETQIREEVSAEFMELFRNMQKDYSERLEREKEILEERAEKRLEILKNLFNKTVNQSADEKESDKVTHTSPPQDTAVLERLISSMTEDLGKIREDAESVHHCLMDDTHTSELEALRLEKQQSHDQLQEANERLQQQRQKLMELKEMCLQKDDIITRLQAAMDQTLEDTTRDRALVETLRSELLDLKQNCCCGRGEEESRKRPRQDAGTEDTGRGAEKRVILEEEIWRLQEDNERKEETIAQLSEREAQLRRSEEDVQTELRRREEEVEELKKEQASLQQKLTDLEQEEVCSNCASVFSSLEAEQKEVSRLVKENKALVNGMFQLQNQVNSLQTQLREKRESCDGLSEQLAAAESRLQIVQNQSDERNRAVVSLTEERDNLKQEVTGQDERGSHTFHSIMEELRKESAVALQQSTDKSVQIQDLQQGRSCLQEALSLSERRCAELTEELANQRAEFSRLRAELESEGRTLQGRLEDMRVSEEEKRREEERQREELQRLLAEKDKLVSETLSQMDTLRQELQEQQKENRVVTVVEELKEEMNRLQERRRLVGNKEEVEEEEEKNREYKAVKKEIERLQRDKVTEVTKVDVPVCPLRSNMTDRKKTNKTIGRKRKSNEVEDLVFSENKRNRVRDKVGTKTPSSVPSPVKDRKDGAFQKIGDLLHSSPSILSSKAKTIMGLVSGHSAERETKPRRGRRKLYKVDTVSPLFKSPNTESTAAEEEKESAHTIIRRQLRSKTCRK
ncbi:kinesin-like protein KIF20A isoform X2 [Cynoglossus semilaevis]|nr:kinesin-like protein KIF20A isoform X2 [Cynoglossus semilaevis]XP_016889784.1 kinesin-like protein KIF20A isoform X2 [Cynoglossus semilaevis]